MSIFPPFLLGFVAGLRAMMAPAAVSWAAYSGAIDLTGTPLAFLGSIWAAAILSIAAIAELISDKRPTTPARTVPPQFGARIVMGSLSGAALGAAQGSLVAGLVCGLFGAVIGTLAGRAGRAALARTFRTDRPAALVEDLVALIGSALIVTNFW